MLSFLLGKYLGVEVFGHSMGICLTFFKDDCTITVPVCVSTTSSSTSLTMLGKVRLVNCSPSYRCIVIPHCVFNLHLIDYFHVPICYPHLWCVFGDMPIESFCQVFMGFLLLSFESSLYVLEISRFFAISL